MSSASLLKCPLLNLSHQLYLTKNIWETGTMWHWRLEPWNKCCNALLCQGLNVSRFRVSTFSSGHYFRTTSDEKTSGVSQPLRTAARDALQSTPLSCTELNARQSWPIPYTTPAAVAQNPPCQRFSKKAIKRSCDRIPRHHHPKLPRYSLAFAAVAAFSAFAMNAARVITKHWLNRTSKRALWRVSSCHFYCYHL